MSIKEITASPTYNPNRVLDAVIEKLQLKNDAALSRVLEVAPPVISKIRHQTLPIGATILLRMHEVSVKKPGPRAAARRPGWIARLRFTALCSKSDGSSKNLLPCPRERAPRRM